MQTAKPANHEFANATVVNALYEDLRVFVLLDDERILGSRPLETRHCAEVHAEQVTRLKLTPTFLVGTLGYTLENL